MKYIAYNSKSFKDTEYYKLLPHQQKEEFDILSHVFHFKTNNYVLEHLINWTNVPDDPIFRMNFPGKKMLNPDDYDMLKILYASAVPDQTIRAYLNNLQKKMCPRLKQTENSYAQINGQFLKGMYRNSASVINLCPAPMAKTCHAYCSYCFRWLMFGNSTLQDNSSYEHPHEPLAYLKAHPEITDVLFTGADPLTSDAEILKKFIYPVLEIESVRVIRISSKALAWWPFRFTTDKDAGQLLKLFDYIQSKGKHLNFCTHFTHPKELENDAVKQAIQRIHSSGAIIRCQGPLIAGVNDTPETWSSLWNKQIALGMIPYYMFMEAQHNIENCFRVPWAKALEIFQTAQKQATPLARTVRGPVFMNDIIRVLLDGTTTINNQKYFVLKNLQTPPGMPGEGDIRLIPFSKDIQDIDLYKLFYSA